MKTNRVTILKIGGSVITDKQTELSPRTQVIDRIAEEIQAAHPKGLMLVHGGGSFGHPVAKKYGIKEGFRENPQLVGFAETHHTMTMLNGLLIDSLIWHNVPAVSIAPSSCIITENGRIAGFDDAPVRKMMDLDLLPVLYGDAVLDTKLGFTILSGDQIAARFAEIFQAEQIIMGVDVDGLYDCDPKNSGKAEFFNHLTLKKLEGLYAQLEHSTAHDVTGGMPGKIAELISAVRQNIRVTIVNASEPKIIYKILKGEKVKGTEIEKE